MKQALKTKEQMMNKIRICLFIYSVCFVNTLFVNTAFALQSIDTLVNQGKLSVSVSLAQDEQHIVGQALVVSIEVATDRWFATGSRVQNFTLPNVVMQANNITTINGSKRIQGQTWAMQTHEITLYPTLAGKYTLPALNVDVSINTENDGIVSGVLKTQTSAFIISLPEALNGIDSFIVSPEVTLTIEGQFDIDKNYAIGEALTQTITITARDTPAMMIPELNFIHMNNETSGVTTKNTSEKTKHSTLGGISVYRKPAQVFDKSTRGVLLGSRVESSTYIFEQTGNYVLPKQIIYWWNSQSNTLEELVIPASSWAVSGGGLTNMSHANHNLRNIKFSLKSVIILGISLFFAFFVYLVFAKHENLTILYKKLTKYDQRQLRQNFLKSIAKNEYVVSTQYLYQYALIVNKYAEVKSLPLTERLNELAFQATLNQEVAVSFPMSDAKALIKEIDTLSGKSTKSIRFPPNKVIMLNKK